MITPEVKRRGRPPKNNVVQYNLTSGKHTQHGVWKNREGVQIESLPHPGYLLGQHIAWTAWNPSPTTTNKSGDPDTVNVAFWNSKKPVFVDWWQNHYVAKNIHFSTGGWISFGRVESSTNWEDAIKSSDVEWDGIWVNTSRSKFRTYEVYVNDDKLIYGHNIKDRWRGLEILFPDYFV